MKSYWRHLAIQASTVLMALGLVWTNVFAEPLVYCSEASPEGFDPALYASSSTHDASSQTIYNRLLEIGIGSATLDPGLAESWELSSDGLTYTFYLRSEVQFHTTNRFRPTRTLNADDVIFSFERQWRQDSPWASYRGGRYEVFEAMSLPKLLKEIVKVNDQTVRFVLKHADASFLANLAMDFASIMSKEYADQLQAAGTPHMLDVEPVGTGPYQLVAYQPDATVRYKAFPDYWGGKQQIDDLIFAITTDPSVRAHKLLAGECDVLAYPNVNDLERMQADGMNLFKQDAHDVAYLAYNTLVPPFHNPEVRRGLNMAINKQAIVDKVFGGNGTVADGPLPRASWAYEKSTSGDTYNREAAKVALDRAGVHDLHMKIWAAPVSRQYNPDIMQTARLIKHDLEAVGVSVEIVTMDWGQYLDRSRDIDRDGAVLLGWVGDNGDPGNFLGSLLSCASVGGNNRAQWCNNEFDSLLQRARASTDKTDRTILYSKAQAIFSREAPWAVLAHSILVSPMSPTLSCFKFDALGHHNFQFCSKDGDCPVCPKSGACPQSVRAAKDECCKSGTCPQ